MKETHRFLELDSLRGLAALAVVLAHFDGGLGSSHHPIFAVVAQLLGTGHASVVLFFLLSGFVLTSSYLGEKKPSYAAFMVKRICRIYLPYVAAILIAAGFASKLYSDVATGDAWIDQTWSRPVSMHLLLQHLIMIGHFDDTQLNTAIWSLIIEMRISLFFPALAWLTARTKPRFLIAAFMPLTIAIARLSDVSGHQLLCDTLFYTLIFILGSLLRRRYSELEPHLARLRGWRSAAMLLSGYVLYQAAEFIPFARVGVSPAIARYLCDWTLALAATTIMLTATTWVGFRHVLHGRVLSWAGSRSYSIYLLHGTILFILIRTFHVLSLSWPTLSAYLLLTGVIAEIFHRIVERPTMLLGRRMGAIADSSFGPVPQP